MKTHLRQESGFTLIEVMIAAAIMIILCIGTMTVFEHAVKINYGNNMRSQAQSVLQAEVEYYRSLKFIAGGESGTNCPSYRSSDLCGPNTGLGLNPITRPQRTSSDGQVFNISVTVKNLQFSSATDEVHATYKEITVTATPVLAQTARPGWLSDATLDTKITFQRVRAN